LAERARAYADWLETENHEILVSWQKFMLTGVKDNTFVCPIVSNTRLKGLLKKNVVSHWVEFSILHPEEPSNQVMHIYKFVVIPQPMQILMSEF
jgi:hypothetical protein